MSNFTFNADQTLQAGEILQRQCHGLAKAVGWWIDTETGEDVRNWPPKFFKLRGATKLALVHGEISEAMEGNRKGLMDDKLPHRSMLEVELADAVIRCFDLAGAIADKLVFNVSRADHKIESRIAEGGKAF